MHRFRKAVQQQHQRRAALTRHQRVEGEVRGDGDLFATGHGFPHVHCFASWAGSVFASAKAQAPPDKPRPDGPAWLRHAQPVRAKRGAGGGTRTHTTLPSRDFKSLASTNSATSAFVTG